MTGDGVRCRRRDFTYSDSNSNSSEGGSSDMDRAECNACNAVILMSFSLITITLKRDWESSFAGAKSDFGDEGGGGIIFVWISLCIM